MRAAVLTIFVARNPQHPHVRCQAGGGIAECLRHGVRPGAVDDGDVSAHRRTLLPADLSCSHAVAIRLAIAGWA